MNTSITARQFELTSPIKEYIQSATAALAKYGLDIISLKSVISADEKGGKKGFEVEFVIHLAHTETVVIKHKDKDLYAAVDLACDRASKVLRRMHDRAVTHKNEDSDKDAISLAAAQLPDDIADEIIPAELDLYKPMEIEEALNILKSSSAQFYVFNDMDAKMRVIYKRNDGKFGLY